MVEVMAQEAAEEVQAAESFMLEAISAFQCIRSLHWCDKKREPQLPVRADPNLRSVQGHYRDVDR